MNLIKEMKTIREYLVTKEKTLEDLAEVIPPSGDMATMVVDGNVRMEIVSNEYAEEENLEVVYKASTGQSLVLV